VGGPGEHQRQRVGVPREPRREALQGSVGRLHLGGHRRANSALRRDSGHQQVESNAPAAQGRGVDGRDGYAMRAGVSTKPEHPQSYVSEISVHASPGQAASGARISPQTAA